MAPKRSMQARYKRAKLPRNAGSWLRNCKGPAGHVIQRSQSLITFQVHLAKILPPPLIDHVQVISLNNDRLMLAADSAVWASQLRHRRNAILRHMTSLSRNQLQQLEIKVSPLYAPPLIRSINRHLPAAAGQNLERAARSIDDPGLAAALCRLASHSKDESNK